MTRYPLLALLLVACLGGRSRADRGDAAWAVGDWTEALAFYRADAEDRGGSAWARPGAAALRAGDWPAAIDAYRRLAAEVPERRTEAVEGIWRAAVGAEAGGDAVALREAAAALVALAPGVPIPRIALRLVQLEGVPGELSGVLYPAALAGVADPASADRVLVALAEQQVAEGHCAPATATFGAVERRTADSVVRRRAGGAVAGCALFLGEAALERDPASAEAWFRQALRMRAVGDTARRALIGLGDARLRQGDPLGAALHWQEVVGGGLDELGLRAQERLNALATAGENEGEDGG